MFNIFIANFLVLTQPVDDLMIELPKLPTYEVSIDLKCKDNVFHVSIINSGFTSRVAKANLNGRTVSFRSRQRSLEDFVRKLHSVTLSVTRCDAAGNIGLYATGTDVHQSDRSGQSVTEGFEAILT